MNCRAEATFFLLILASATTAFSAQEDVGVLTQHPSPSPTGTQVVFAADFDGQINLWLVGADGTGLRKLTYNPESDEDPAWSPDGKTIAFASTKSGVTDIWSIQSDGSHLVQLTSQSLNNEQPAWSPDGKRIAFVSDRGGSKDIWLMNADGSTQSRLTTLPGQEDHPSFSPDGTQVVFSETGSNGAAALFVVDLSTSGLRQLTTGNGNDWNPQWSAGGVLFSSNRGDTSDHWKIWIVQPDGSGLHQIGDTPAVDPVFLPNGRIIFSDEFSSSTTALSELTVLDPTSSAKQQLTSVSTTLQPADVNNDGTVDCLDLNAVRSVLGLKLGQSNFNPRADTNHDGVIDVRDLAFVAQHLPSGLTCK